MTRAYRRTVAVRDLNLEVQAGCLYGLVGKSGAGKTTTLSLLLGLVRPTRGQATVMGRPASQIHLSAGKVGATLDTPSLYGHLTVKQQLHQHGLASGRRIEVMQLLDSLELGQRSGHKVSQLSAGERQRLALAQALALQPEVLILDEPLVHLDPALARTVMDVLLVARSRGAAILLSSHHLAHLERAADEVAFLHEGTVRVQGKTEELLGRCADWLELKAHPHAQACSLLSDHPLVEEMVEDSTGESIRVRLTEPQPQRINRDLHAAGVEVRHLAMQPETLDDIFLQTLDEAEARRP